MEKRILITGASGGIGSEIALKLACKGTIIGIHYNNDIEAASELEVKLKDKKAIPILVQADLASPNGRKKLLTDIKKKMEYADILINNAGGMIAEKELGTYSEQDVYAIFELNFMSSFFITQELFPIMCSNKYGRIVNISSIGVKFGGGKTTLIYSAAKSALELMTLNLAKQGAKYNVTVNAIRAGVIDTSFHKRYTPNKDMASRISMIPMKHSGQPADIANMTDYLVSPKADFITGQIFAVSGGE